MKGIHFLWREIKKEILKPCRKLKWIKLLGKHHGVIKYGIKLNPRNLAFSLAFPVIIWLWANYITSLEFRFLMFPKIELDYISLISFSFLLSLSFIIYEWLMFQILQRFLCSNYAHEYNHFVSTNFSVILLDTYPVF